MNRLSACLKLAVYVLAIVVVAVMGRAQLAVEPESVDLGKRLQQQVVETEVKLVNKGKESLEILHIGADCSCTAAVAGKKHLEPGESTALKISVETRSYQGEIHRRLALQTSQGEAIVPVKLKVVAYENWEITPMMAVFSPSVRGEEASIKMSLAYSGKEPVSIKGVVAQPSWMKTEITQVEAGRFSLTLTKPAQTPAGNHTVRLEVQTSDPAAPSLMMTVFVPISSELKVSPSPILMPVVKVGAQSTAKVRIEGWRMEVDPRLVFPPGEAKLLIRDNEMIDVQLSVTPTAAGVSTRMFSVYSGEELQLEVPVILRVDP